MSKEIYLDAPNIGEAEKQYLNKAANSGYVSTAGPFVQEFEERFAGCLGIKKAVSTQSGTAAIHTALHELGLGEGDEVIVPALTFVATVNPVMYVGARPVFVDVDFKTWNISPDEIRKGITGKTKAIIPVHLYGNPCNMEAIMKIAAEHKLYVIEDATESLGAKYKDRFTGTFGDLGCFSFNGNKVITTGGGGMVVGRDEKRLEHIKFLVNQARDEDRGYYHPEIGFNYRMTNIEAALGLAQMERLNDFLAKKRRFNALYREAVKDLRGIRFQEEYEDSKSSCWLTCIAFENRIDIPAIQKFLKERGVPARKIFTPVTEFPPYVKFKNTELRNTYQIYERGLCLPGSTLNTEDDIAYVCNTLKEIVS